MGNEIIYSKWNFSRRFKTAAAYMLLPIALLLLNSCFKEKTIAPPNHSGTAQTAVIEMGPQYTNQYFYSLATNSVISSNSRFAYDLMFDCDPDRFYIWLNTSKFMAVVRTGKTDMNQVVIQDTTDKFWYYELGQFYDDSNAIGQWWQTPSSQPVSRGEVYILSLGIDLDGNSLGLIKMKIGDFNGSTYSVSYCNMDNSNLQTLYVAKDPTRNYRYLTFTNNTGVVDGIEPDKTQWDFCVTRYSVAFYNYFGTPFLPYLVTGVLNNPTRTTAYMDSSIVFDSVKITDFDVSRLQSRRDAIGYEWKRFSSLSENGTYSINAHYTYYTKTDEDEFYKIRFISFEKDGVRGYPTFEFERL